MLIVIFSDTCTMWKIEFNGDFYWILREKFGVRFCKIYWFYICEWKNEIQLKIYCDSVFIFIFYHNFIIHYVQTGNVREQAPVVINFSHKKKYILALYLILRKVHIAAIMDLHAFPSVASAGRFAHKTIFTVSRSAINILAHNQLNRNRAFYLL